MSRLGRIRADGKTFRGSRFTREQAVSGLVMRPGGGKPGGKGERGDLERLLRCLFGDAALRDWLRERGIDAERLVRCLGEGKDSEERASAVEVSAGPSRPTPPSQRTQAAPARGGRRWAFDADRLA